MVYYLPFLKILLALTLADRNRLQSTAHYNSQNTEQEVLGRTNHLFSSDDTDRIENDASNSSSLLRERVYRAFALQ
jgi:hypothetical protein